VKEKKVQKRYNEEFKRQATVLKILQQWISREEFKGQSLFYWPLVRDNFRYCTCLIADREVVITPPFPLVNMIHPSEVVREESTCLQRSRTIAQSFGRSTQTP
jgi:hypothetical protein